MSLNKSPVIAEHHNEASSSMASYAVGFGLSVALTLLAFLAVSQHWLSGTAGLIVVAGLALIQFSVQLLCFLHLGNELRPRLKLNAFIFMLIVVFILVAGSIWIMNNLDYHMHGAQINTYLHDQDRL